MHSSVSLMTLAGLAAAVAATPDARNLHRFRDLHVARQTDSGAGDTNDDASCTAGLLGIVNDLPTPASDLLTWLAAEATAVATMSDICSTPPVPTSLTSAYSSYQSELLGWYSSESQSISALASSCSGQPGFSQVDAIITMVDQATSSCFPSSGSASSGSMTGSMTESVTSTITTESVVVTESGGSSISITVSTTQTTTMPAPTDQPAAAPRATAGAVMAAAGAIGAALLI